MSLEIERTHPSWSKTSRVCLKNTSPSLKCNFLNTLFRVTILHFRVTIWSFEVQYLPSKRATFAASRSSIGDFKVACSVLNVTNVHNFLWVDKIVFWAHLQCKSILDKHNPRSRISFQSEGVMEGSVPPHYLPCQGGLPCQWWLIFWWTF